MEIRDIETLFSRHKESSLVDRYLTNKHIEPLLKHLPHFIKVRTLGCSVLDKPIYGISLGTGHKKILMWSQMHGNESTTTKAIFDLLNTFVAAQNQVGHILETCTIFIIPILNPDGAEVYTRLNANLMDLNRDAQTRSQPESKILRAVFEEFKPDYCYNLHGQRTIFSAGRTNKPATVSFLSPAQDKGCTVTPNRMISMEIIAKMNEALQKVIPGQVGVYDDAFNINCVGDTFQSENVPTILFEAGHYPNDYDRNETRKYIYMSYLISLDFISKFKIEGSNHDSYFKIPENDKCFFDIIIRNVKFGDDIFDIGIQYQERLVDGKLNFVPKVERMEILSTFYGHKEINASGNSVLNEELEPLKIDFEVDSVMINNEKISLLSK